MTTLADPTNAMVASMRRTLGVDEVGQTIQTRGGTGVVERITDEHILIRLVDPVAGFVMFRSHVVGEGKTMAAINAYYFSPDAAAHVEREQPAWQNWLENLTVSA